MRVDIEVEVEASNSLFSYLHFFFSTSLSSLMIPQLPPELIESIIHHSLPSPSFLFFPSRNALLLSYSLVSPVWLAAAQAELYQDLWIADKQMEELLWDRVGARQGLKELRAKRVWCGRTPVSEDSNVFSAHFVDRALSYCPNAEKLSLTTLGMTSFDFSALEGTSLSFPLPSYGS